MNIYEQLLGICMNMPKIIDYIMKKLNNFWEYA